MRLFALALLSILLAACAATSRTPPDGLFADSLFAPPSQAVDAGEVLTTSDAMKRYLAAEIGDHGLKGRQRALVAALRREGGLKLEYDASFTRNAAQAFEARAGNCLSLVIMTSALAREIGVWVRYQSVYVDDTWSLSGDLQLFSGHVNLTLGRRPAEFGSSLDEGEQYTIDFLPPPDLRGLKWRVIGERTVLAMYMNNRAAESLAAGRVDDAYWFAREAIGQDPRFASAYNTLGVIYERRRVLEAATLAFRHTLALEPANTRAMSNLAPVLARLGRFEESQALLERLHELEPEGNWQLAIEKSATRHAKERLSGKLARLKQERDP